MKILFALFLLLFSTIATSTEWDSEPQITPEMSPTEKYHTTAVTYYQLCSMQLVMENMLVALEKPNPPGLNFRECIEKNIAKTKTVFDATRKTIKKASALNELKNYHALWVSAMKGIVPGGDERKITYDERQRNATDKLNQAWARFELEL